MGARPENASKQSVLGSSFVHSRIPAFLRADSTAAFAIAPSLCQRCVCRLTPPRRLASHSRLRLRIFSSANNSGVCLLIVLGSVTLALLLVCGADRSSQWFQARLRSEER